LKFSISSTTTMVRPLSPSWASARPQPERVQQLPSRKRYARNSSAGRREPFSLCAIARAQQGARMPCQANSPPAGKRLGQESICADFPFQAQCTAGSAPSLRAGESSDDGQPGPPGEAAGDLPWPVFPLPVRRRIQQPEGPIVFQRAHPTITGPPRNPSPVPLVDVQ